MVKLCREVGATKRLEPAGPDKLAQLPRVDQDCRAGDLRPAIETRNSAALGIVSKGRIITAFS